MTKNDIRVLRNNGILINPKVPEWMDDRALEKRSEKHMKKWLNVPYIRTEVFGKDNYSDYCERMAYTQKNDYIGNYKLKTEEEFNNIRIDDKKNWLTNWPDGIRYDVRILDGGAWDRTSYKGSYKTLENAIIRIKKLMK